MFKAQLNSIMERKSVTTLSLASSLEEAGHPVNVVTIDRWRRGECEPRPATLVALAGILDVTPNDLLLEPAETEPAK